MMIRKIRIIRGYFISPKEKRDALLPSSAGQSGGFLPRIARMLRILFVMIRKIRKIRGYFISPKEKRDALLPSSARQCGEFFTTDSTDVTDFICYNQ
jgi:hypothetical protein